MPKKDLIQLAKSIVEQAISRHHDDGAATNDAKKKKGKPDPKPAISRKTQQKQ